MKIKPTRKSLDRFNYFVQCEDGNRLEKIPLVENGYTAAECFHAHETFGKSIPCREPELLTRAINGKEWHGVNVTNWAEDYVGRILFSAEIRSKFPEWVQRDIFGRAGQIAMQQLGFVPTFVKTSNDFSTL